MVETCKPSQLEKALVLVEPRSVLHTPEVAILVVVQDRRDFCRPGVWVVEIPALSVRKFVRTARVVWEDSLCHRCDFRDFVGIEEGIGGTAISSADIKRENELPRGSLIGCTGHRCAATV